MSQQPRELRYLISLRAATFLLCPYRSFWPPLQGSIKQERIPSSTQALGKGSRPNVGKKMLGEQLFNHCKEHYFRASMEKKCRPVYHQNIYRDGDTNFTTNNSNFLVSDPYKTKRKLLCSVPPHCNNPYASHCARFSSNVIDSLTALKTALGKQNLWIFVNLKILLIQILKTVPPQIGRNTVEVWLSRVRPCKERAVLSLAGLSPVVYILFGGHIEMKWF